MISDIYFRFLLDTISKDATIKDKPKSIQELNIEPEEAPLKYFNYLIEFNYSQNIESELGLTFGKNVVALNLCDFFRMINTADTVGDCLNSTVSTYHVLGLSPYPVIKKGARTSTLSIAYPYCDMTDFARRFTCEVFFSYGLDLFQKSISNNVKPTKIQFDFPEPSYAHKYAEMFDCEIIYDAPLAMIEFETQFLTAPLVEQNKPLHNIYMAKAFEQWRDNKREQSFRYRVITQLMSQHPYNFSSVTLAENMSISTRGLQKRLAAEDCTFSNICKFARRELCKICLFQKGMSLEETASALGFQTQISFRKFFKETFNTTPKSYYLSKIQSDIQDTA